MKIVMPYNLVDLYMYELVAHFFRIEEEKP
jgi:hypothetical protein